MSLVNIALSRGKSDAHLAAVSQAVHDSLVAELDISPADNFQLIGQYGPGEMVFHRDFRGGPRLDWIVISITDSQDHDERSKRAFYKTLVRQLEERAGVRPPDVFVTMSVTNPANFSYAGGVIGTDVEAAESLDAAPARRDAYSKAEMSYAVTRLFQDGDRGPILPMLSDDVVLTLPATLPYGGVFTGRATFDDFFAKSPGGSAVWASFDVVVDDVIASDDHLIARLTNTGVPRATGKAVVFQNLWLFTVAGGRIVGVQLYADTAVVSGGASR